MGVTQASTPPYTYSISGDASSSSGSVTDTSYEFNVPAGTYTVKVTDANGCLKSFSKTFTQPAAALAITETISNVTCNGQGNGSVTLNISGGTIGSGYNYAWTSSVGAKDISATSTSKDQSALTPGTYTVVVTDANGCTETETYTITEPTALALSETISNFNGFPISCNGANDATIDITVSGGTSAYTYSWTTVGGSGLNLTAEDQTGLGPGTYTVVATDQNSCTISKTYTITEPDAIAITGISPVFFGFNVKCNGGNDGAIDISVTVEL